MQGFRVWFFSGCDTEEGEGVGGMLDRYPPCISGLSNPNLGRRPSCGKNDPPKDPHQKDTERRHLGWFGHWFGVVLPGVLVSRLTVVFICTPMIQSICLEAAGGDRLTP